jgi:fatty-acyl-CoA synthase
MDTLTDARPRARKASPNRAWLRALELTGPIAQSPARTFPAVIAELAERFADTPALLSDRESLTYRELAARANRYARWALAQDLAKGETVCLMMPNRPEYMAAWLGIAGAGGVVALINTNLTGRSLAHCIDIVASKHVIVAAELAPALAGAREHLATAPKIWSHGGSSEPWPDLAVALAQFSDAPVTEHERPAPCIDDPALYVYTSGTTGLPKAAKVTHFRLMVWTHWFAGMMDTGTDDRMYNCLPMYHSIGGAAAML